MANVHPGSDDGQERSSASCRYGCLSLTGVSGHQILGRRPHSEVFRIGLALRETLALRHPPLSARHDRMAREIEAELERWNETIRTSGDPDGRIAAEVAGWNSFMDALLEAIHSGSSIEPILERGYRHVLFLRDERAQRDLEPSRPEDWATMRRFDAPEDIRRAAE